MDRLRCVVERVTYQNETNGYSVIKCRAKGYADLITVVGSMPEVHVGSVLTLSGEWTVNPKFGRQFTVSGFEETLPATVYGIEKYLGSGLVKGIGPKFAARIVRAFGAETLNVIEEDPDALLRVPGIGKLRVERIKKSWDEQKEIKNIMLFLQGHDVSTTHATKIYKTYGSDSIRVVKENPYRLADDIWGIGFRTADTIAEKLGVEKETAVRLRSGLLYTLNRLSDEGHCYARRDQLLKTGAELLAVEESVLPAVLDEMVRQDDVKTELIDGEDSAPGETAVYLPPFWFAETGTAKRLKQIFSSPPSVKVKPQGLEERIRRVTGLNYDPAQMDAIRCAAGSKILILTGGPGTGKTTTTLGILTAFRQAGAKILLAAPTGRAAKRLSETTGMEARTIHRLLEFKPPEGCQKNEQNPLEGDVLILDECSMIDIMLMYSLLKAVPDSMTLIFVGDVDQLPSVGAGNVLRDLIDAGVFPVVRLTKIFRQAAASRMDIQVLTPMQRGAVGAANLNQVLQAALNADAAGLRRGGTDYRLHDKVMQIRNNYDKEVFNGDIGTVCRVNTEDRELTVSFDGREVLYDVTELDELVLAYAATVHKSQGSEYPIVVMPVLMTHYVMLQRNLVYTGVTRAKKLMVMIGSTKALALAVRNITVTRRNTMLKERLKNPASAGLLY